VTAEFGSHLQQHIDNLHPTALHIFGHTRHSRIGSTIGWPAPCSHSPTASSPSVQQGLWQSHFAPQFMCCHNLLCCDASNHCPSLVSRCKVFGSELLFYGLFSRNWKHKALHSLLSVSFQSYRLSGFRFERRQIVSALLLDTFASLTSIQGPLLPSNAGCLFQKRCNQ
jgi:hypothetical protein